MLLNLNLKIDVLFQGGFDLIGGELGKSFLEEMHFELDIEVLLLQMIDVLLRPRPASDGVDRNVNGTCLFLVTERQVRSGLGGGDALSRFSASGVGSRGIIVEWPSLLLPGSIEDVGVILLASIREVTEFPERKGGIIGGYCRSFRLR